MNGKMTVKRRQERVGHRLQADLRNARPGSPRSYRGDTVGCPPLPGRQERAVFRANLGGTAEGLPFVPMGTEGVFYGLAEVKAHAGARL